MEEEPNFTWEGKIVEVVSLVPDAVAEASTSKLNEEEKPLLQLIKILVHIVDNEEKTVLTNSQLMDILQKEFKIDVANKSELEVDIFMNILKKFLKSWPRWDEFDTLIKKSKTDPNHNVDDILSDECESLKTYLAQILSLTAGQMDPILKKLTEKNKMKQMQEKEKEKEKSKENGDVGEVVMEISCSRLQLDKLFYRYPYNKTIFNIIEDAIPQTISLKKISWTEILNWPSVQVSISLPWIDCTRKNSSHFERVLRNLKLPYKFDVVQLPKEVYWRNYQRKKHFMKKVTLVKLFNRLKENIEAIETAPPQMHRKEQILGVLTQFKHDFVEAPDVIALGVEYQFFLNRYKYVRYLSVNPPSKQTAELSKDGINIDDFELRLEECISPAEIFQVTKLNLEKYPNLDLMSSKEDLKWFWDNNINWLKIECSLCDVKFDGFLALYSLDQHFAEYHNTEKDWLCQYCGKTLTMECLTSNRWYHKCATVT